VRCVALAVGLVGCGRIHFDALPVAGDATGDASADGASADVAMVRCNPAAPFTSITPITDVNIAGAYDSTFTPRRDELTAYFYSDRSGNYELYIATRPDLVTPWTVAQLTDLADPGTDKEPSPSSDGTVLLWVSTRAPATAPDDIFYATGGAASWTVGGIATALSVSGADKLHPFFQNDSNDVWFASNSSGVYSIYHSTWQGGGSFAAPTEVPELDASGFTTDCAIVDASGLVMYFRSNRPGGPGGIDIFLATRPTTADAWVVSGAVTELDTPQLDTPNWISPDLCRLYMSSSRTDTSDIYVATRTP
jgi:hypothetical protein